MKPGFAGEIFRAKSTTSLKFEVQQFHISTKVVEKMQCGCKKISVLDFSYLIIHIATVGGVSEFNFKKKSGLQQKVRTAYNISIDECFCSVLDRLGWFCSFSCIFVAEPSGFLLSTIKHCEKCSVSASTLVPQCHWKKNGLSKALPPEMERLKIQRPLQKIGNFTKSTIVLRFGEFEWIWIIHHLVNSCFWFPS